MCLPRVAIFDSSRWCPSIYRSADRYTHPSLGSISVIIWSIQQRIFYRYIRMLCLSLFSTLPFRALGVLINERYRHGFYVRVPYHRHYMRIYAQALLYTCPKRNTSPIQYRLFYSGVVISRETKKKKLRVLPLATLRPRCAWQFLFVDFRVAKWWNIWWWIRGAWSRATHLSRNNTNINRRGETVSSFVPSHRLAVRPYIYI